MAKGKKEEKCPLTDDQVNDLGEAVSGSTVNIYPMVESKYGVACNDTVFEALERVCSIRRCIECNLFRDLDMFEGGTISCMECADSLEGDCGDEDE